MSQIDTSFSDQQRSVLVAEVRNQLPAFLDARSTERADPVGDVEALLGLTDGDLQKLVSTHVALSEPVRRFIYRLPTSLRRPIIASSRPRLFSRDVRGPIDWGATVSQRATKGLTDEGFVTRPAQRMFDTPENRALCFAVRQLRVNVLQSDVAPADDSGDSWKQEIHTSLGTLELALRTHWLRDIPAEKPDSRTRTRLRAARSGFYSRDLLEVLDTLERYVESPTPDALTEIILQRHFVPSLDWQLFEVVVALRLAKAFSGVSGGQRKSRLLVGSSSRGPYARFVVQNGLEVRLWYQAWPNSSGESVHRAACEQYSIRGAPPRPDLVIERVTPSGTSALILELKASTSSAYLSQGVFQLIGYMADRPDLFTDQPAGWLVAPESQAFETVAPEGSRIWVVSAAAVADEAVRACFQGLPMALA